MTEMQNVDKFCHLVFEKDLRTDFHVLTVTERVRS